MMDEQQLIDTAECTASEMARAQFQHTFDFIAPHCESPIERVLLAEMIKCLHFGRWFDDLCPVHFYKEDIPWPQKRVRYWPTGISIAPQVEIRNYRVDFLVRVDGDIPTKFIVIECDGHDFHERTKFQAARDKTRDRWMVANDIAVFRYTGSEIWKDAGSCVNEIRKFIFKAALNDYSDIGAA